MRVPFAFWKSSVAVFDPGTLALSGWWRASYSGAPWAATASAGVSATTGALIAGVAPATGTAQNGFTPADFDGTTQYLTNATDATTLFSTTNATLIALVWVTSADVATGNTYDDGAIYVDGNADLGMTTVSNGANINITGFSYVAGYVSKAVTVTAGAYHLVMMRTNGTVLGMTVDSVAETTIACGTKTSLTGTAQVGEGYLGTHKLKGRLLELMTSASDLSASYSNIKSYVNSRYALAL